MESKEDVLDQPQTIYVVLCSEDYRERQWIDGVYRTREEAESRVDYIAGINYTDGWTNEEDAVYAETDAEVMETSL
jgi:hypothetical protein